MKNGWLVMVIHLSLNTLYYTSPLKTSPAWQLKPLNPIAWPPIAKNLHATKPGEMTRFLLLPNWKDTL